MPRGVDIEAYIARKEAELSAGFRFRSQRDVLLWELGIVYEDVRGDFYEALRATISTTRGADWAEAFTSFPCWLSGWSPKRSAQLAGAGFPEHARQIDALADLRARVEVAPFGRVHVKET